VEANARRTETRGGASSTKGIGTQPAGDSSAMKTGDALITTKLILRKPRMPFRRQEFAVGEIDNSMSELGHRAAIQ